MPVRGEKMTIEINIPIKCSTVKKINKSASNLWSGGIALMLYSLLPAGTILLIISIFVAFFMSGNIAIFAGILGVPLGISGILLGRLVWSYSDMIKFKCVPDEVSSD